MRKSIIAATGLVLAATATAGPTLGVQELWSYQSTPGFSSEIGAWDSRTGTLFVVGGKGLEVLDLAGSRVAQFDASAAGFGEVNSIAIHGGMAAVSFTAGGAGAAYSGNGSVRFFDTAQFRASGGSGGYLGSVAVGAVPDMVTWAADGQRLLVANEGERRVVGGTTYNPVGSVSVVDVNRASPSFSSVSRIGFEAFDGQEAALRAAGVRIAAGQSASVAVEPEYIAISRDGRTAQVTLQEANAIALVDLVGNRVTDIKGLGLKDFSLPANRIDPSDRDGLAGSLRNVPVKAMYQPDAIASYGVGGRSFYVIANEGDAATDDSDIVRFGSAAVTLDPTVFNGIDRPTQAQLKPDLVLGRLNIVRNGATGDGNTTAMKEIVTIGGRSFSILDDTGRIVYDSGSLLEEAAIAAGLYDDGRSDDKGVEPEGVTLFEFGGRTIAAIGMERTLQGAVALFDVTDPYAVSFMQIISTGLASEFRVEGISAFEWNGNSYLALHNEDPSNTTVLFQLVPEPGSMALAATALLLAGAGRRRATPR